MYNPQEPNRHYLFYLNSFTDDDPPSRVLNDGYAITLKRVDPAQLEFGMYAAKIEENRPDSVLIRIPYLDDATQDAEKAEIRATRAKFLNSQNIITQRARHELGYNLAMQRIRSSGNPDVHLDGLRSTWFRVSFPTGTVLTDSVYGDGSGYLTLDAIAHQPDGTKGQVSIDICWKISIVEEPLRYAEDQKRKKKSYLTEAMKGL